MNFNNILPFLEPPGCLTDTISNPYNNKLIEVALFPEHRFAFYYWLKWTQESKGNIPSLVTFDWHQDLCPPYEDQEKELKELNIKDPIEVAIYTWGKLSHDNDVQIHAALKHNMIKDVYVICRQDVKRKSPDTLLDYSGNKHKVHIFKSLEAFIEFMPKIKDTNIYLDVDLDYFTLSNPLSIHCPFGKQKFTYLRKKDVVEKFSQSTQMMKWILTRMCGFTIATEPKFCGGLNKSNFYLEILESLYFTPSLFLTVPSSNTQYTKWKTK